jgi:hypothetical protein
MHKVELRAPLAVGRRSYEAPVSMTLSRQNGNPIGDPTEWLGLPNIERS